MKPHIYISVPCGGNTIDLDVLHALQATETAIRDAGGLTTMALTPGNACLSITRNLIVDAFLKTSCTHILMVDSDVIIQPQWVLDLIRLDESIVGGFYIRKIPGVWSPTFHAFGGKIEAEKFKQLQQERRLMEVDGLATGFMLVKKDVFIEMKNCGRDQYAYRQPDGAAINLYNWFPTQLWANEPGLPDLATEDIGFCRAARQFGFKSQLATWMQAGHKGQWVYN